ncbi:undecaprenyl phosphate translocase family protein [Mycoplasma todarodis]|uniref:DUF368 domain-containing protein n=1 Tax=Mycoplasma todarodis TaxID=1937191 RepID=A0A4R0XM49_9MOLU|nr:DUF368 domain-containing protein [Mycoplasma todarodis]TCG11604.1 hypothetical protein C4B25_01330 [Mycoplasma todarodis]
MKKNQELNNDNKIKTKSDSLPKRMAYGVLMGLSDGTPGFSGGTTLSLLNFYDKLIMNFKGIFKPEEGSTRIKHLLWVLPFLIMWVGTLLGFMLIMNKVSEKGYGVIAVVLFSTFALLSIPLFILVNKPKLVNENTNAETSISKRANWKMISLFVGGFIMMIAIGLIVRFAFNGVTMIKSTGSKSVLDLNAKSAIILLIAGFCAGFAMLIPGISGSLLLYLFNTYTDITNTVSAAIHGNLKQAIPVFLILGVAIIAGLISSVLTTSFILKRWREAFVSFSFGLVSASFITILIALSGADYASIDRPLMYGLVVVAIFAAIGINVLLALYLKSQGIIEFKRNKKIS